MIVDTSALVAILLNESEALALTEALLATRAPKLSSASYVEAALKLVEVGSRDPVAQLDDAVASLGLVVTAVDHVQARAAVLARLQFGKGRHPAGLNYGECFAYALAKVTGEPLLYKGDDFARTDVISAL